MRPYIIAALLISLVGVLIGASLVWWLTQESNKNMQAAGFDHVSVGAVVIPLNQSLTGSYEDTYAKLDFVLPLPEQKELRSAVKEFIFAHLPDPAMYDSSRLTEEDRTMRNESAAGQYAYDMKGRIETAAGNRTSYVLEIYEFTGGAHGSFVLSAKTYDKGGKEVSLSKVLGGTPNYDRIAAVVRPMLTALIKERQGGEYITEEYFMEGTQPTEANYQNWYLKDDTVVFIFNQYQIGPYAIGMFELPVALEALR